MRFRKSVVVSAFAFLVVAGSAFERTPIDWSQPPVGCVEELYPKLPSDADCAALSADSTADAKARCKLLADVRAEETAPGVQMPMGEWLTLHMYIDRAKKVDLIYSAAEKYGMPPAYLYGVINLEAMGTDLGIIRDGGNYSCGTGSLNIWQWCRYMSSLAPEAASALGWPVGISCDEDSLPPEIIASVFGNADFSKSSTVPNDDFHSDWQIQLRPREADAVSDEVILAALKSDFASKDNLIPDAMRLQAIRSFTRTCGTPAHAIPAIAYSLKDIYDRLVPRPLKKEQTYESGTGFERACARPYVSKYYPYHAGWLLAYGIHNQGEDLAKDFKTRRNLRRVRSSGLYTVVDLVQALREIGGLSAQNVTHVVNRMALEGKSPFAAPTD